MLLRVGRRRENRSVFRNLSDLVEILNIEKYHKTAET